MGTPELPLWKHRKREYNRQYKKDHREAYNAYQRNYQRSWRCSNTEKKAEYYQRYKERRMGASMYTVEWCDHEGNLQRRTLNTLEDARLEANELYKQYDGVRILDQNRNEIVSYQED